MTYNLQQRLVEFSALILAIAESLTNDRAANHLRGYLIRAGSAPSLLYAESQSAESRKDFIS
jgi:hypothetical protein